MGVTFHQLRSTKCEIGAVLPKLPCVLFWTPVYVPKQVNKGNPHRVPANQSYTKLEENFQPSITEDSLSLKPGFYRDQLSKFLDVSIGENLSFPYFSPKYQLPDFPLTLKNFFFPTIPCSAATQQRCCAHELGPFLYSGAPLIWPHTHKPFMSQ